METAICKLCNLPTVESANFCHHCGTQIKCTECGEVLIEGANNCVSCGFQVLGGNGGLIKPINQIKFRENKDERWYEINFTNDVGKEIKEVVADILKNRIGKINGKENVENNFAVPSGLKDPSLKEKNLMPPGQTDSFLKNPTYTPPPEVSELSYPHLNDLDIRLNCTENEWLLIYAFYHSGFGTSTFSKDTIWQLYKEKRLTETRFKNLGTNWKSLFKKYLSTVKENEFRFTALGLGKVKSLLLSENDKNKSSRLPRKGELLRKNNIDTKTSSLKNRKALASSIVPDEFDVYKNNYKISLEEFFTQKKPGNSNPNRIVTIAYYITKVNHQEYFTEGNIDYAYRILNLGGKPAHLKQIIINLKNERIWFKKVIDQGIIGWRLTRQAEIYVEEKLI